MWQLTIRNLLENKRRVLLTAVAVLLGVAFMGTTQILGATVQRSLTTGAGSFYEQLAAEVRGPEVGDSMGFGGTRLAISSDLGPQLAEVDGVTSVIPTYNEAVTMVKADGKVTETPKTAGVWFDDAVQPLTVIDGVAPSAADEVAMPRSLAEVAEFEIGDTVRIESSVGPSELTLTGLVEADGAVAGTTQLVLGAGGGERLLPPGEVNGFAILGDNVDVSALRSAITREGAGGPQPEVRSGAEAADDAVADAKTSSSMVTATFSAFGALSLFVGIFIIYNTFNILMAQRRRDMALLRAIGVRRKQVVRSVMLEAGSIGLVAGIAGAGLGVLIAIAGRSLLLGDIEGSLVVSPMGLVSGVLTGVVATTSSAWIPARRAARVAPVEALREAGGAAVRHSRVRLAFGVVLAVVSGLFVVAAMSPDTDSRATVVGAAAFVGLLAVIVLSPMLATLLVPVFGAPVRLVRGQVGRLASENARRQPQRTAATATALLVGVAIVGFALVIASSLKAVVANAAEERTFADYVVTPVSFGTGLTPNVVETVDAAAGDATTSLLTMIGAEVDETTAVVFALDAATASELLDFRLTDGEFSAATAQGILVDQRLAAEHNWTVGDQLTVDYALGDEVTYPVAAIGDTRVFGADYVIDAAGVEALDPTAMAAQLLVGDGADRDVLEEALFGFPNAQVQTPAEVSGELNSAINLLLQVLFGFLGLSVIIAFIGVTNTLSLSIHERTRELGILRAIALRRSHVRSAVRWEAAIIAALGTVLGIAYGAGFGAVLASVLADTGFAKVDIPWLQLAAVVAIAAAAGALAAALPARRAARLDVLDAIHQM